MQRRVLRRVVVAVCGIAVLASIAAPAGATFPFPTGGDPSDYTRLHITDGNCLPVPGEVTDLPSNFDCVNDWELTDRPAQPGEPDYDQSVAENPQELFGAKGSGTNRAFEITTGRPDTIIAVTDSGIRWSDDTPHLVNKFALSRGELPVPCPGEPCSRAKGGPLDDYDLNGDGVFDIRDYGGDPRVSDYPDDGNAYLDPADLIRTWSDGVDDDANGYPDDISGWDFFERDNNPGDDVSYGHGTGESEDSAGELELSDTQCGNCMLLELRVGDSFVAEIDAWAEAVVYAVDNGASVLQEALGALDHTAFAQAAADYAYRNGVLIVASAADEEAGHHNYPAALNHTMVVNSLTQNVEPFAPRTYLALNGCTNFGGYIWMSAGSPSCSSGATGQTAGMAGLLYSAARNAVDQGLIEPGPSGRPLSAEEAKQLFRLAADDIDFSSPDPPGPANNFDTGLPTSRRFTTTAGWDQITGWGRANADRVVRLAAAGHIPPEADITYPRWWQPLGVDGTVPVVGRVAAPRASSYSYRVAFAPGVQPPKWPDRDRWVTIATGGGNTPKEGILAEIPMAAVRAAIDRAPPPYGPYEDPTAPTLPERDAFRVRVVVSDDDPNTGDAVEQRQFFARADPALVPGMPRWVGGDGIGSPAFADLDRDGRDELLLADSNGFVHLFRSDGSEPPGWPVHTDPIPLPNRGINGFTTGQVPRLVYAPVLIGSPAVADLDQDGRPEVSVASVDGKVYAWRMSGVPLTGFPVASNPDFVDEPGCQTAIGPACDDWSTHDVRDSLNPVARGFTAAPAAVDLDPAAPGLELVAASTDGHVYAWHADGSPVAGWPVLIADPSKVEAVDPVTHKVTFAADSGALRGRKLITTPSVGDVDGDGTIEVALNTNEAYAYDANWSVIENPSLSLLALAGQAGNTRVYLLRADGTAHAATGRQRGTAHPDDQAYVPGWPVPIGTGATEVLPNVGEGSNGSPVLADVDGDGSLEVATASILSPPYLLRADGSSFYGTDSRGKYRTMGADRSDFASDARDGPSMVSLAGGAIGRLGAGPGLVYVAGSGGLGRALDVLLPEQQLGVEDHLGGWDAATGDYADGYPAQMNDLQLFATPALADLTGDGLAEVLAASAMYDLRAYAAGGTIPTGWPRFTGGWVTGTPAVGDQDGDGLAEVALVTREGWLYVWRTDGLACQGAEWPKYQHDAANTGNHETPSGGCP